MLNLIFMVICACVLVLSISLLKVYSHVPPKELKRRAQKGDEIARQFHRAVAYGNSLEILLWIFVGLSSAGLFVALVSSLSWMVAFVLLVGTVVLAFGYLPKVKLYPFMVRAAQIFTPVLHWILERTQPAFKRISRATKKPLNLATHSGIYEKSDLIELVEAQAQQIDNRIAKEELAIAANALQFGERAVKDVMTPKRMIKLVNEVDVIGPVLMDELFDSGHSRFPVYKDNEENIIGTLYLRDMIHAKAGGLVKTIIRKDVFYVPERASLARVLDAFIKTKHHLFLVVNNFEEIVGVVSIEDIVEQILGRQIVDEFDQYDNMRAVAGLEAKKDRDSRETVVESDEAESSQEEKVEEPKEEKHEDS